MSNMTIDNGRNNGLKKGKKNNVYEFKKRVPKKKTLMNVEDVVEEMSSFRRKIVQDRKLPLKEEYKVVVTFSEIEKQLRSSKPKKKKIDKYFNVLLKIFTTVKLSNTKECIDNVNEIKQGVDNVMSILCL